MPHSFFEKSVGSFLGLMDEVDLLDLDSGIRTFGDYQGKKRQFVFVTRSPNEGYVLMVHAKKKGTSAPIPGRRLLVKEFRTREELGEFMKSMLSRPVRAFIY
ncbi:MAG: hypothetical protein OK449_05140 [Thaumarchaeota archaeon]|nr:hypothetical protein [Nitrososphaerota archaeon]